MGKYYKIFTIKSGVVSDGAVVSTFFLKGAGINIPAIVIGEDSRNGIQGILAVDLPPDLHQEWKKNGSVKVYVGKIGKIKSGKFKLFAGEGADTGEKILAVFETKIGFKGWNNHTGDRNGAEYALTFSGKKKLEKDVLAQEKLNEHEFCMSNQADRAIGGMKFNQEVKEVMQKIFSLDGEDFLVWPLYNEFPGEILIKGKFIYRGGSGEHVIALMPKGVWFRTGYGGRLYGEPPSHYYRWDGEKVESLTWEDRQLAKALCGSTEEEDMEWL